MRTECAAARLRNVDFAKRLQPLKCEYADEWMGLSGYCNDEVLKAVEEGRNF